MNFDLSEEQELIKQSAREFAVKELWPGVIDRDEKQEFPVEQIKKMGALGFLGMMVDPRYGGGGWIRCLMCWLWKKYLRLMLLLV